MLFNSFHYALFLPITVLVFYLLPTRYRWFWLVLASFYFYMVWRAVYVLLMMVSILAGYISGHKIQTALTPRAKFLWLMFSVVINLGLLAYFKYYEFIAGSLRPLLNLAHAPYDLPMMEIILPVGISFHTFQIIGYNIDCYRGEAQPERGFGNLTLFVAFFPQMVAGPIERTKHMMPQMANPRMGEEVGYAQFAYGLRRIAWGLFKKVVIADSLALYINAVYNAPSQHHGPALVLATILFAYQIYCDFSGYTDIAIGSAQLFGINLMENFRRPYHAPSVREFWRRWHISLSTWLRDYLYFAMGGSRVNWKRHCFNLLAVFFVCGLWHGAKWTFVAWGALHGFYLVFSILTDKWRRSFSNLVPWDSETVVALVLRTLLTFALVDFAWIFFRANSMPDAIHIISHLFKGWNGEQIVQFGSELAPYRATLITGGIGILALEAVEWMEEKKSIYQRIVEQPAMIRWSIYVLLTLSILIFGTFNQSAFIYFQF